MVPHLLHHTSTGASSGRAVLFLHGFMGSSADWSEIISGLSDQCYSLAVDLPGHGASTGLSDAAYSMEGTAQALVNILDHHGIDRCAVVGYSMGGRLALYFALQHSDRCTRVVVESASPGLATEAARVARRVLDEERAGRLVRDGLDAFLAEWYRQPLFASLARHEELAERMTAMRQQNDPRELARSLHGMGTGSQPSLWERLSALSVATLAVAGTLDAKYAALARQMAERSRCLRAVTVPQAGHNVHAEAPRCFLRVLNVFLP